jgi:hypothetical protein
MYGKKTISRAALALAASAALVPFGQGSAAATGYAAATGRATASTLTTAAVPAPVPGPAAVVPASTLALPQADTLLTAGGTGFLHLRGSSYQWTPYGGGNSTTLTGLAAPLRPYATLGGWLGEGSDVVAQKTGTGNGSILLRDMAHGGTTTSVALPTGQLYQGTYGSTVLTRTVGTAPVLHLLRAAADGSTTDLTVSGLTGVISFGAVIQGDATGVAVQYQDKQGFHLAVVDLASGAATSVPGVMAAFQSLAQIVVTPTALVVQPVPQQSGVEVYDRADLTEAPQSVSGPSDPNGKTLAFALVGSQVLGLTGTSSGTGYAVSAQPVDGGTGSTLLGYAFPEILPTPDGGALVAGATDAAAYGSGGFAYYRVPPVTGDGAPALDPTADVVPVNATTAGLSLSRGTLTVVDNSADQGSLRSSYEALYSRALTLNTATPTVGPRQPGSLLDSVGNCGTAYSCSAQLIGTGDGLPVVKDFGRPVKVESLSGFNELDQGAANLLDADGRYVAFPGGSGVTLGDFDQPKNTNYATPPPLSVPGTVGAVWSGRFWVGGGDGSLVGVFDGASQGQVATFDTGAPCTLHDLQVVGRWVYWDCDDHTAGIYDWTTRTGFTLPSTGHGYDDALLGDGFLVYHDATAGQLVLADVHTGALTSTQDLTALGGGTSGPDRRVDWTVDRYTGAVAWLAADGTVHAEQTGVPASAPAVPSTTPPKVAVPAWLFPVENSKETKTGQGATRTCTGILISPSRLLTGADCFTGRTSADTWWVPDPKTHAPSGGGTGDPYRTAPQYNAATRQDDLAVHVENRGGSLPSSTAPAALATTADSKLYRAGQAATFYSWTAADSNFWAPRAPHAEPAVVRSAADCAKLLGHAVPAGMLCTSPGAGAVVTGSQRCLGDDGGALVAGGKLIGVGATAEGGCSAPGVRLYTSVAAQHSLIGGWARDIYPNSALDGAVSAVASDGLIYATCGNWMKQCLGGETGNAFADNQFNLVLQPGDLNGDGWGDLILRTNSGHLYDDTGYHDGAHSDLTKDAKTSLGTGWNAYNLILAPGDVNGDGLPDLLARAKSGALYLYPGNGHGTFGARKYISAGWNAYTIAAHGDFSGDGITDLLVRDAHGVLWRRNGNGHGGFTAKAVRIGSGWAPYTSLVAVGDQDGQGHNQLIGRLSNGQIYRWTDNGKGGLSAKRVALGGNSELRKARLN